MMGKTTFITQPDLINLFILARHDTFYYHPAFRVGFTADIQCGITAHRAVCTYGGSRVHLPGAGTKTEIHCRQCADRADVGGIAREDRIKTRLGVSDNIRGTPAPEEIQHRITHDLILKADTACALNAAFTIQPDQVSQGNMLLLALFVFKIEATGAGAVFHRQILQRAFPTLVADRAIQRVRSEKELDDLLLC